MRRVYKKPPVIEALCQANFAEPTGDFTTWGEFYQKIKDSYPSKLETPGDIKFQITPDSGAIQSNSVKRFTAHDNAQAVQADYDFFILNRLSPYLGYEQFSNSFADVLRRYRETFAPKRFTGLTMRYVNQIIIPSAEFSLSDYLGLVPVIPEGAAKAIGGVLVQVQVAPQIDDHLLQITLQSNPSNTEGKAVFFLDIFDGWQGDGEANETGILKVMNDAHENIGHLFEKIIQDKLRKLFEQGEEND